MPSILLLDCSQQLHQRLAKQGFNVESGNVGFVNGKRKLPRQIYEHDIFIYNPQKVLKLTKTQYIDRNDIKNESLEFNLEEISGRINSGGLFIAFLNNVATDIDTVNEAYEWIPMMTHLSSTKDNHIEGVDLNQTNSPFKYLTPVTNVAEIKNPVLLKFNIPPSNYGRGLVTPIFRNRRGDGLGVVFQVGNGVIILLPEFNSNDEIINTFANRIIPNIYGTIAQQNIIDQFNSTEELAINEEIENIAGNINELNELLEQKKAELETTKRMKVVTIKGDETASQIISYFDVALQQEDVALFFLYKVKEALEHKYGGEKVAKQKLGYNTEWNLIGTLANASYADIRHAPKPGEKIKEPTQDEINSCFEATHKIINAYITTLF